MNLNMQTLIITMLLSLLGLFVGQITKVCYEILAVGDDEKEPPVFEKKNFIYSFNLAFGLPTMILFPFLYAKYGFSVDFCIFSLLGVSLVGVFAIDYKHYIIPDKLNIVVGLLGIVKIISLFISSQSTLAVNHILGGVIGGGAFLLLALISLLIYKQEGMGFGDIKLMLGLGFIYGIKGILVLTLIAFVIGAIICIILIGAKIKKMKEYIPFGPFLCIAATALMFVQSGFFVDWYFNLLK